MSESQPNVFLDRADDLNESVQNTEILDVSTLTVASWNIHGNLVLKLASPQSSLLAELSNFDLVLLQESHLRPDQHLSLPIPKGYSVHAVSRPLSPHLSQMGGGVLAIMKDTLPFKIRLDLAHGTDIMVIQIGDLLIINAYVPPTTSSWELWSDIEPVQILEQTLALCYATDNRILLLGDLNARTGSRQTQTSGFTRSSPDGTEDTRGRNILEMLDDHEMFILNGCLQCPGRSDGLTSFQYHGNTVIDYIGASTALQPLICDAQVLPHDPFFSDHAAVTVTLQCPQIALLHQQHLRTKNHRPKVTGQSPIDLLLRYTIDSARSTDEARDELFGPVLATSAPIIIYTDGSCHHNGLPNAAAASAVYWGPNSSKNWAERVPGAQTNNRAEIYAIYRALLTAPFDRDLHIYSDSEYAIRLIYYWSYVHASTGWTCTNGDILEQCILIVQARYAPLRLYWVKAHARNTHNNAADSEANKAVKKPPIPSGFAFPALPCPPPQCHDPMHTPLQVSKVWCDILETPQPKDRLNPLHEHHGEEEDSSEYALGPSTNITPPQSHRGRAMIRALQKENMQKLLDCIDERSFWSCVRTFIDPKPATCLVMVQQLATTFKDRMNPPTQLPPSFSIPHLHATQTLCNAIPENTDDATFGRWFSRPWSTKEIQQALHHVRKHNMHSALGLDQVSYETILSIPTENLQHLFQECIDSQQIPSDWTIATLAAILKKGKAPQNPDSYRVIGLQSCFLKLLTLLIDRRFRAWDEAKKVVPPSQNGFRPRNRTSNNPFVLRCLVDKAKSLKKPLYVAFIDLTNAFPSTDHSALWLKLYRMGVSGPIFDWLRKLYKEISYTVRADGQYSDVFKSLIGILAGDPASPQLWNLFLSDFCPPTHQDDLDLDGTPVSHLEQADDMAIVTTTMPALQLKLHAFARWCSVNFLVINYIKTVMMAMFYTAQLPDLYIGSHKLSWVTSYVYVGVSFTTESSSTSLFSDQYKTKRTKARQTANVILGLQSHIGPIPPFDACKLYKARIDPHLIFACELSVDCSKSLLSEIQDIQHLYLRAILGLNPRSTLAVLFTETGITPIKYRRLLVALRFLKYLLGLPPTHLARCAMADSMNLRNSLLPSWFGDLCRKVHELCDLSEQDDSPLHSGCTLDDIDNIIKQVESGCQAVLQSQIAESRKLALLQHNEMRIVPKNSSHTLWEVKTMTFRHYLNARVPAHRFSLTRLLLSDHCLAIEQLRRSTRNRPRYERHLRICRLCNNDIEDELHALFTCTGNAQLDSLRTRFHADLKNRIPTFPNFRFFPTPMHLLQRLYKETGVLNLLARFVHQVLKVYDNVPLLLPQAVVNPASQANSSNN